MTIDNIWVEHTICGVWATNVDNSTITNLRIRDTFADGVNLTNGSSGNTVSNDEARSAPVTTASRCSRPRTTPASRS